MGDFGALETRTFLNTSTPEGAVEFELDAAQVEAFKKDPASVVADLFGVSRSDYLAWRQAGYDVRCSARTKSGERCKNLVAGGNQVSPAEWAYFKGDYCPVHGGASTEENNQRWWDASRQ